MDGPHSPVSTLSFPTGPLSSFADTWAHVHLDGLPSHASSSFQTRCCSFLPKVALVAPTSSRSLGPDASGLSCLCVPSPATSPHPLGPFQSCRCHDGAVLLEVTRVCVPRPAIVVGCLGCLFNLLLCLPWCVSHILGAQ